MEINSTQILINTIGMNLEIGIKIIEGLYQNGLILGIIILSAIISLCIVPPKRDSGY